MTAPISVTKRRKNTMTADKVVTAQVYTASAVLGGPKKYYWYRVPPGENREQAFDSQPHYGPFDTEAEVEESQRLELF
jgi:hypothetical protein